MTARKPRDTKAADRVQWLRDRRVFNLHGILCEFGTKEAGIGLSYHRRPDGRMGICHINKTAVYSPFFQTNKDAHWQDNYQQTFSGNRSESMPKAMAWCAEKYGITEWVTCPFDRNEKIPASVLATIDAAMKIKVLA